MPDYASRSPDRKSSGRRPGILHPSCEMCGLDAHFSHSGCRSWFDYGSPQVTGMTERLYIVNLMLAHMAHIPLTRYELSQNPHTRMTLLLINELVMVKISTT
jgi:hypothetical protein